MRPRWTTSDALWTSDFRYSTIPCPSPKHPSSPNLSTRLSQLPAVFRLQEATALQPTVSPVLSSGLLGADSWPTQLGRPQRPLLVCTGAVRWQRCVRMSRTLADLTRSHLGRVCDLR